MADYQLYDLMGWKSPPSMQLCRVAFFYSIDGCRFMDGCARQVSPGAHMGHVGRCHHTLRLSVRPFCGHVSPPSPMPLRGRPQRKKESGSAWRGGSYTRGGDRPRGPPHTAHTGGWMREQLALPSMVLEKSERGLKILS